MTSTPPARRRSLWAYYERRASDYDGSVAGTERYFTDAGVDADPKVIAAERKRVRRALRRLPPASFVDVGAGPGVFTALVPGRGVALDQSRSALSRLRTEVPGCPVVRGDVSALPLATKAVERIFAGHVYGHLEEQDRLAFLDEARRVADELVILDSGRPPGARAEEWQSRALGEGESYTVYKRHFEIDGLLAEVGGEALFIGQYYVLVRATG